MLRGLAAGDWDRPTVAGQWSVRDVAAHLLDGDLRRLAMHRDCHAIRSDAPLTDHEAVVAFVNQLNASGVELGRRLSSRLITDLLEVTGPWIASWLASLPVDGEAYFPVTWAGESRSANWLDVGREYTERWHHQLQIRDAVGAPLLLEREWRVPALEISLRALPGAYARVSAPAGTAVALVVGEDAWSLVREHDRWSLARGLASSAAARVDADPDTAWRIFYNAPLPVGRRPRVEGDATLAAPLLAARSVLV